MVWSTKAPPTTINLVWRALSQCLPTLTQLQAKHVRVQNLCPVCSEDVETIMHSLVSCPFARQCWMTLNKDIVWSQDTYFMSWFSNAMSSGTVKQRAEYIVLCWAIWRARNDLVWNQRSSTVNRVVAAAKQCLTQWILAQNMCYNTPLQPQVEGDGVSYWVKPQPNTVKVSVDATIFEDREEIGFGLIARNSEGALIDAAAMVQQELVSPVLAEAMAIKEALSWIVKMQWPRVTLESDCLTAVEAIRSRAPMRSRFVVVVTECRDMMHRLNKVTLLFVKRSANMVAHQLARESYVYPSRRFDRWSIPTSVNDCIQKDLLS